MKPKSDYAEKPCYLELIMALLTGIGHVTLEVSVDGLKGAAESLSRPQHYYNMGAAIFWGLYIVWRLCSRTGATAAWGFRKACFGKAIKGSAVFAIMAAVPLLVYGKVYSRLPLPLTFWLIAAIYPFYGIAQQFVLQALVTKNLRKLVPRLNVRVLVVSILFSAAHFPNYSLMILTFFAGLGLTWVYERHRNIWAVGVVHGILGALAYYLVVGQDPGADIMSLFAVK